MHKLKHKIYNVMVKNIDSHSRYGKINKMITAENESSQLSVSLEGIERHKINFVRAKIYHILLKEEVQLKNAIVKE